MTKARLATTYTCLKIPVGQMRPDLQRDGDLDQGNEPRIRVVKSRQDNKAISTIL